jgi:multiple sugar transport system permease protein
MRGPFPSACTEGTNIPHEQSRKSLISAGARRAIVPYLYQGPTLILLVMLLLIPIVSVVRDSCFDNIIVKKPSIFVGLANYKTLFADEPFRISVGNTLYFTAVSVVFHLLIGFAFALLLNAKSVKPAVKATLRVFYIMPWVFTASIIAIVWRLLLDPRGVVNFAIQALGLTSADVEWFSSTHVALHALTFVNIWAGYPFYMVSLLAGLQGIPSELYEAATIDGAGGAQKLWFITIPQLMPVIVSIAMLDFIWTMQVFPLVWMTTGGGPLYATEMLSTYTYKLAFRTFNFSLASASAVIMLILCMCVAIFYVRVQKAD